MCWRREKYPVTTIHKNHNSQMSRLQPSQYTNYIIPPHEVIKWAHNYSVRAMTVFAISTVRTTLACEPAELEMTDAADLPTTFSN